VRIDGAWWTGATGQKRLRQLLGGCESLRRCLRTRIATAAIRRTTKSGSFWKDLELSERLGAFCLSFFFELKEIRI
jgi:hypothetical protein